MKACWGNEITCVHCGKVRVCLTADDKELLLKGERNRAELERIKLAIAETVRADSMQSDAVTVVQLDSGPSTPPKPLTIWQRLKKLWGKF